jgi:peptide/nickel transport system substrate-binding protein
VLALLAACAAPAAAPTADQAAAPAAESASDASLLIVGIAEDTASLDPARAYETLPTIIHKATYETLVTFPDGGVETIEPALAESWTISDDGTVYTFTLNPAAVFSNGEPVKASDVVFSFNRMVNIKGNPSFLADGIVGMEAPDDATFVLTLANPDPAILAKLVFGAFSVTSQAMVEAQGGTAAEDAAESDTAEQWLNNNSAGSGAYVIEKWDPQVETVLVRNENYWGTPAAIERIVVRNLPEAATQKLQLEAGDLDIAFDLGADQVAGLADKEGVAVYEGLSDTLIFLKANNNPEISAEMSNPLVQKAIRLALDYEGMRALSGGQSVTPASVLPVGFLGAMPANSGPQRDLDAAKALLAEAGFDEGELNIEITYPDFTFGGFNFGTAAQKIQADLLEAGMNATLKPTELQVALEAYRQGTEPFGLWLWLPDYRDSNDYLEFLPEGVVGIRTGWVDATGSDEVKAIRDAAKVETDPPARVELFQQMQEYLIESGPYAAVLQPGIQIGLSADVQGFVYNPQWRVDLGLLSK